MDWCQTSSGGKVWFPDPKGSTFTIDDIAQGLATQARFKGQWNDGVSFSSIAMHSINVMNVVRAMDGSATNRMLRTALMHDAPEFIMGDMVSPLKRELPDFRAAEDALWHFMAGRFRLHSGPPGETLPPAVKYADHIMLMYERTHHLTDASRRTWCVPDQVAECWVPYWDVIEPAPEDYDWRETRARFLEEWEKLQ